MDMDFSKQFDDWLATAMASAIPTEVIAFSFNLFELGSAEAGYGVELVGTDEFDMENSDWACAEAWVAHPRFIAIPRAFSSGSWQACLRDVKQLAINALSGSSITSGKLKEASVVAVGFTDGDLELIWQR